MTEYHMMSLFGTEIAVTCMFSHSRKKCRRPHITLSAAKGLFVRRGDTAPALREVQVDNLTNLEKPSTSSQC